MRYNITHMHATARNTLPHFGRLLALGRVVGSDLVLSVCNTCAGQYTVLYEVITHNITPKPLKKSAKVTDSGQKWPLRRVFWT